MPIKTHGMRKRPEYTLWHNMLRRCRDPNHHAYDRYGGRGIVVCDRWLSFAVFIADMGERPSPELSVERQDNDGPYSPGNCVWAYPTAQSRNKRKYRNNRSGITGVYSHNGKWRAEAARKYLGQFDTVEQAVQAREAALLADGFNPNHGRP